MGRKHTVQDGIRELGDKSKALGERLPFVYAMGCSAWDTYLIIVNTRSQL